MLKRKILAIMGLIFVVFIIFIVIYSNNNVFYWAQNQWLNLFYSFILAIIAGIFTAYAYIRFKPKNKISERTLRIKPKKILAKLVLPGGNQCIIKEYERIFGREDFLGIILGDKLNFIGKKHFKVTKMDDGFYIEDLNTKNGTWLNDEDIRGLGKKKLGNNDKISIANVLKIKYNE